MAKIQRERRQPRVVEVSAIEEAEESAPIQTKTKLVRATVARGRTVDVPIPGSRYQIGLTKSFDNPKPVFNQRCRQYGPGSVIELPADEAERLRALGYLVDPARIAPPVLDPQDRTAPDLAGTATFQV
jgi:hypothetical protein